MPRVYKPLDLNPHGRFIYKGQYNLLNLIAIANFVLHGILPSMKWFKMISSQQIAYGMIADRKKYFSLSCAIGCRMLRAIVLVNVTQIWFSQIRL